MKLEYDYALAGAAVRTLLGAPETQRRRAERFIEELTSDPFRKADFSEMSPSGRTYSVFVEADIILTMWVDHSEKEVRIVSVEFA